jgi:hypothetical protein
MNLNLGPSCIGGFIFGSCTNFCVRSLQCIHTAWVYNLRHIFYSSPPCRRRGRNYFQGSWINVHHAVVQKYQYQRRTAYLFHHHWNAGALQDPYNIRSLCVWCLAPFERRCIQISSSAITARSMRMP